jgi:hypothetical protein
MLCYYVERRFPLTLLTFTAFLYYFYGYFAALKLYNDEHFNHFWYENLKSFPLRGFYSKL